MTNMLKLVIVAEKEQHVVGEMRQRCLVFSSAE